MEKKVFFQSSIPRSGSTLLQNILAQNPDFYTTPTSGLLELIHSSRSTFSNSLEFKAQDSKEMESAFKGYCKGAIQGYFSGLTDKPYVVDKSRGWGSNYDLLSTFTEDGPKIICMVRDLRAVFSSMEKKYRSNPLAHKEETVNAKLYGTTVEKRVVHWATSLPIGLSLDSLRDIIVRDLADKFLFVRFEDLTSNPKQEVERIYEYLGVENYEHDFNNVEQKTKENDALYGIYGDHKIMGEVKPLDIIPENIIGPNSCQWVIENYTWYFDKFNYKK